MVQKVESINTVWVNQNIQNWTEIVREYDVVAYGAKLSALMSVLGAYP